MNLDQVMSAVRSLLAVVGGYAVGRGWINSEQLTLIGGVAASLVPLVWGIYVHTTTAKIAAVEAIPDVKKIVVAPTAANGLATVAADPSRPKITVEK